MSRNDGWLFWHVVRLTRRRWIFLRYDRFHIRRHRRIGSLFGLVLPRLLGPVPPRVIPAHHHQVSIAEVRPSPCSSDLIEALLQLPGRCQMSATGTRLLARVWRDSKRELALIHQVQMRLARRRPRLVAPRIVWQLRHPLRKNAHRAAWNVFRGRL